VSAWLRERLVVLVARLPGWTWLSGGAIGIDLLAAHHLIDLGQRVELVTPFPPDVQSTRWSPGQRQSLRDVLARVAAVEVLRTCYHVAGYRERNQRMLERADLLVVVWDGGGAGGTASMVSGARRRGMPVIHLWPGLDRPATKRKTCTS
jgi:uncharacterized phage-like protein YoqJ